MLPSLLSAELPVPDSPAETATDDTPLRLDRLESYKIEMEFWLAVHRVDTRRLDAS